MTYKTRTLNFSEFILAHIAANLFFFERDTNLLSVDIFGEAIWAPLTKSEKLSIGGDLSYMAKHDLIPFVYVGKTAQNANIYRLR